MGYVPVSGPRSWKGHYIPRKSARLSAAESREDIGQLREGQPRRLLVPKLQLPLSPTAVWEEDRMKRHELRVQSDKAEIINSGPNFYYCSECKNASNVPNGIPHKPTCSLAEGNK